MKKKKLKLIISQLDDFIRMNERHMQIQDNALIRKDEEITILTNASKQLRIQLEKTQEALSHSRNFVRIIQSDKRRSIKDMAKDLYGLYYGEVQKQPLDIETEGGLDQWMGIMVEILSGEKIKRL